MDTIDLEKRRLQFIKEIPNIHLEMEELFKMGEIMKLLSLGFQDPFVIFKWFLYILGLLLNLLSLFIYDLPEELPVTEDADNRQLFYEVNTGFGTNNEEEVLEVAILLFSIFFWIIWIVKMFPLLKKKSILEIQGSSLHQFQKLKQLTWNSLRIIFTDDTSTFFISVLVILIAGRQIHELFLPFLPLMLIKLNPVVGHIWNALAQNFKEMLATLMLSFFIIYCFGVINAGSFSANSIQGTTAIDYCNTLYSCTLYVTNVGFRSGGGLADKQNAYSIDSSKFYPKLYFNLAFFFIIKIICLNIVFGMIINGFAELREAHTERNEELQSTCFICEAEEKDFEGKGKLKDKHDFVHSTWKYPQYIYFLSQKMISDLTGVEISVWNSYSRGRSAWMPFEDNTLFLNETDFDALEDKEREADKEITIKEEFENMSSVMAQYVKDELKKMNQQLEKVKADLEDES